MPAPITYPFDPTGALLSNKIVGEQQVITAANFRDYHFLVPKLAPFFAESLVVQFRATDNSVRTLVEGVDYYITHQFIAASRACAKPVYGSISLLDTQLAGVVTLGYQTLGGIWTQDDQAIAEILADQLNNPRITAWDVVVDMPVSFPVIDHEWDLVDLVGASEVVEALDGIGDALRATGEGGLAAHVANKDNPHETTKAHVGLALVQNYGVATAPDAIAGTSGVLYMTPLMTMAVLNNRIIGPFNLHAADTNNPHATTAAQVGAYSKVQADLLYDDKVGRSEVAYDTARVDGKTPTEYRDWVLLGTAANSLKFNGQTYLQAKTDILTGTAANSDKLENKTLQQIKDEISSGGLGNAALFDGKTYAQAKTDILSGSISNANAVYGYSFVQLQEQILMGQAADALTVYGLTQSELTDYMREEVGGWETLSTEQAEHAYNITPTASPNRWIKIATLTGLNVDAVATALLSNPTWLVSGAQAQSGTNLEAEHHDCAYLVRLSVTKSDGPGVSSVFGRTHATALGEVDFGLRFGTTYAGGVLDVWMMTPGVYRGFTVTQITKGIDNLTNTDTPEVAVDVIPSGIVYGDFGQVARMSDIASVRSDVEAALDALTVAFNALRDQVNGV